MPLNDFNDNDVVFLRIKVSDTAGIESEYTYVSYTIDKTAPSARNIKVIAQEERAVLTWSDCSETDLSGFEIYRSVDGGVYSIAARRGVNSTGNYSFVDNITADSVKYRIDAVDKYGNINSIYTETVSTKIILRAVVDYDDKLTEQTALEFSASKSVSYYGIVSYKWSFSDNTSYEGETVEKIFSDPGSYTVTLIITDAQGNTSEINKTITVTELVRYGTLKVRVVDETGSTVPGCGVYLDLGSKQQKEIKTSSDGCVSIQLCIGMHEIGVYKDGYLPDSRTISISCDTESEIVFKISKQEIVSGDFVVREMNFAEIVDAGIDVNDPANQQIYKVKVTLIYGNEKIPVEYIRTKTEIREYKIYDSDIGSDTVRRNYTYDIKYIPNDDNKEIIAVVRMPVNASYLKQFFTATLTVFNNAGESYRLVDCKADIPIPDGLTLMSCTPISSVIPGGTSSCQTLVLRGDTAGTYSLNADFSAVLEKFNKKVNASFVSNSFNVYDKNDVALVIEIPKSSVGEFRFNIGLENRRNSTAYYPQISINGIVEDITAQFKKLAAGDSNIKESDVKNLGFRSFGSFLRNADGSAVLYDNSEIPTEKIEPGCGVFIEYSTINMSADGAEMYFSRAVIDCEETFGGYVEIRFIEDNPLPVSEDEYIKEHIDFINGNEYPSASFDFASYMGDEIKKSSVYKELGLLSWGLGDITDDIFNKLNDEIAADYVNQIIEASTEDSKIQLKFMKKFSEITGYITDIVIADDSIHDKVLFKNKIDSMLKGTDYDSSTNQMLHTLLGKYVSSDVLDDVFAGYDTLSNISTIYHGADDLVDGIKQLTAYVSAIDAYRSVSDDIKQNLLDTAENMQNSRLKDAVLSYANTAIDEEHYKSELRGKAIKNFVGNVFTFYKFSYGSVVKKAIKKLSVNVLKGILPGVDIASVSADFSVSLGLISATRALLSGLSQADRQREALKMIIRIADAAAASKSVMETEKTNLVTSESIESAKAFDTAYKAHKRWQLMAYSAFEDYGNAATDNIIAKTIGKNKREENLEALADVIAQENRLKGIFCHVKGHELGCSDSKVIAVQCPVDVKLYDSNGVLAAQISGNSSTVYDNLVSGFVFGESKLFAVPANLDYSVEITASGAGKMDYTVFEYKNGTETRKVCFDSQIISKADIFKGSTGTVLNADAGSYAVVKNSKDLIAPTDDITISVSGITIDKNKIVIDKDNTCKLNASVTPTGVSDIKWKSSDARIVSVDSDGQIKANKAGNAEIYAVSVNGGYIAAAEVTVLEHDFDSEIIKTASCTNEGSIKHSCKRCGFFDYEIIEKTDHVSEIISGYNATCTETGLTDETVCSVCHTVIKKSELISPTGHCDDDNDGKCDRCGFDMNSDTGNESNCPCGKYHSGLFAGLIKFIHRLIYFFKNMFKK